MTRKKKFFIDAYWPREPKASGRDEDCLWFHAGKKYRVHEGDRVILFETKRHPDHPDWRGSGKVFQSASSTHDPIKVSNLPKVGGQLWDYKVPLNIEIKVDRDKGVEWGKVRKILGWQPGATLRNPPQKITESQFLQIEDELRRLRGDFAEELKSGFDERDEATQDYCEKWGVEGGKTIKTHVAYERDRNLVIEAKSEFIKKRGRLFCEICNLSLEDRYGNLGKNIVDIHHIIPVSQLEAKTQVKISDLIPVCPNCHRIIHSKRPFLSVDDVRKSLRK